MSLKRALDAVLVGSASAALAMSGSALAISQSGEAKNMKRVGHVDLQGRSAYQPNVIDYPDGKRVAFVGTHTGTAPNPLNGNVVERNGTMVVDVTDPKNPVETFHIPTVAGQSQMVRLCRGADLPQGPADKANRVYLMRNIQGGGGDFSGYEVWDVTNIHAPVQVSALRHIRSTHKHWWECTTGIAYLVGSLDDSWGKPLWRQDQAMVIFDWKNPTLAPTYIRSYGLPGGQPSAPPPPPSVPPDLHGPISTHEHPRAGDPLASGEDVIGNRLYLAYGVGDDGILQIVDRTKLLPPPYGGTYGGDLDDPSDADLEYSQAGILYMSPDQGGHTSFPVFGLAPPSYQSFAEMKKRDIVLLASESTANRCNEAPHWSFVVDVTFENSKGIARNPWQGPMVLSTMHVDPRAGEKYPRGNYCTRGARFGVHSSEENFRNPLYGKLTALAYFTGGVRVWDIREPHAPVEVAFYVPENNAFSLQTTTGYMTNNLEIDDDGYIYAADRGRAGLDILELSGPARHIVFPPGK